MQTVSIEPLDKGFLITIGDEKRAALSNGRDLCEWIAVWSKADVDIFEHYEKPAEILTPLPVIPDELLADAYPEKPEDLPDIDLKDCFAEKSAPTVTQETGESVFEPVATKEPEPAKPAPAKRIEPNGNSLTPQQRAVLKHLQKAVAKNGNRIQIENATLAGFAQVPKGSIHYIEAKLEEAGLIRVERQGGGTAPFFTVTDEGMKVAA